MKQRSRSPSGGVDSLIVAERTAERGSFFVRQNGLTVASGSRPYDDIKREAAHYAAVYRQDGSVKVSVHHLIPGKTDDATP